MMTTDELLLKALQTAPDDWDQTQLVFYLYRQVGCSPEYAEAWYDMWKASQEAQGDINPECMGYSYSTGYASWLDDVVETFMDKDEEVDAINPSHYRHGGVEAIDAIKAALGDEQFKGYLKGNAIKYLYRMERKGEPKENAEKCRWYTDRLISELSNPV